jgi:hypothetical protein
MPSRGIGTFFHHVEDAFKEHLPINLYDNEPLEATVIDSEGNTIEAKSYVFSSEARYLRTHRLLKRELLRTNGITSRRIGNTSLTLIDLNTAFDCGRKIVESGRYLYDSKSFTIAAVARFGRGF